MVRATVVNWTAREKGLLAAAALLLIAAGWFLFPPWQAERRYESAVDYADKCRAAQDAADAWGGLGFADQQQRWANEAKLACAMGRLIRG